VLTINVRFPTFLSVCATSLEDDQPMTDKSTRSELAQALAKAVAYRDCGKPADAAQWAAKLVKMLEAQQILTADYR
jgi:hypothetical protein